MPLDPFFRDRLRAHRRYLAAQAWKGLTARLSGWAPLRRSEVRSPAAEGMPAGAAASVTPARSAGTTDSAAPNGRRPSTPRARHRRAALNWDRTELETVGVRGPDMETAEHVVPVPGFPDVRVRVYRPASAGAHAPACLVITGGAFRIGGIDYPTTDAACRRRADRAGVVMVAVGYALAPEHRYPTQPEQVYAAWCWLHANAEELGIDPARVAVNGTSAGGCLAASLTLMLRDRGGPQAALQVLEVPVTDLTGRWIDLRATYALGIPALFAIRELVSVARTYLGDDLFSKATFSYASPMRASSHAGLPPAVILTAEYDPLRRDGAAYAARLRAAGVEASATRYLGVTHDIPIFVGALPAARRWEAEVVAALQRL